MKKKICFQIIVTILIIGIIATMVLLSLQNAEESNHLSKDILGHILIFFNLKINPLYVDYYNFILRKVAHFSLYFLLGTGVMGFLLTTPLKLKYSVTLSILFCTLFALIDELHQYILGTRNGNPLDVLLDSMGALLAIIIFGLVKKFFKRK